MSRSEKRLHVRKFHLFLKDPRNVNWKKLRKKENHWEAKYPPYRSIALVEGDAVYFHWIGLKRDSIEYLKKLR